MWGLGLDGALILRAKIRSPHPPAPAGDKEGAGGTRLGAGAAALASKVKEGKVVLCV